MKVLIDADGCPVVRIATDIAFKHELEVVICCDTAHIFNIEGAKVVTVGKGFDSADFALVNRVKKGDIVISQDYGLASMCLAKGAKCINQSGKIYDENNIDGLLMIRHENKKLLKSGKHIKGPSKRTNQDNTRFIENFTKLIMESKNESL